MYWNWKIGGVALGLMFFIAIALVKPIGVSTQYVIFDGILARSVNSTLIHQDVEAKYGYKSTNAYLNKSGGKYAKNIVHPINYGFIFALSMIAGGFIGRLLQNKGKADKLSKIPSCHLDRFGDKQVLRYTLAFIGGILVLLGARLAGGCSSGHMMSGIMQTSLSGYAFTFAVFSSAIPTAIILYRKGENR